ncbi:MAG TPA: 50S ribosomal protein L15 [Fibrobacteria bacterium]|nr:50S ribosomal protein L15 [Fibrobacteria bacterium]
MNLSELRPKKGSRKKRFKVGRGPGSGKGKTAGRGGKGQTARKSGPVGAAFEGGQMPLQRRVPKFGFKSHFPKNLQVVNLGDIDKKFSGSATVTSKELKAAGLIRHDDEPVKVLATGKLNSPLVVKADKFSATALAAIEAAGGKAEVI